MPDLNRLFPQSQDSELGLLGSILLAPIDTYALCTAKGVTPESFYVPAHQTIYAAMSAFMTTGKPLDFIVLTQYLRDIEMIDKVGGAAFVTSLFTFVPTAANAPFYIDIIKEKELRRKAIVELTKLANDMWDESNDVETNLIGIHEANVRLAANRGGEIPGIKTLAMAALEYIDTIGKSPEKALLYSGIFELDDMIGGIPFGIPVLIRGPIGGGKSSLMQTMAIHAIQKQFGVAHFSLELPDKMTFLRYISALSGIPIFNILSGRLTPEEKEIVVEWTVWLQEQSLAIEASAIDILQIRSKARALKLKYPNLRVIVLDYAQKVVASNHKKGFNREQEVAFISDNAQKMSVELDCIVLVGSQFNAQGESRESSSLSADARLIIDISKGEKEPAGQSGDVERILHVNKNTNGPTGDVKVVFKRSILTFGDRLI